MFFPPKKGKPKVFFEKKFRQRKFWLNVSARNFLLKYFFQQKQFFEEKKNLDQNILPAKQFNQNNNKKSIRPKIFWTKKKFRLKNIQQNNFCCKTFSSQTVQWKNFR